MCAQYVMFMLTVMKQIHSFTTCRNVALSYSELLMIIKRTLYSEKNMNSLNVEYFLAMNIQNLD